MITEVSGLPPNVPGRTVVSRVFGKQLEKISANSRSRIICFIERIWASTASLRNLRSAGSGRFDSVDVGPANAKIGAGASDNAPAPAINLPVSMTIDRLVMPFVFRVISSDIDLPKAKNLTSKSNQSLSFKEPNGKRTRESLICECTYPVQSAGNRHSADSLVDRQNSLYYGCAAEALKPWHRTVRAFIMADDG